MTERQKLINELKAYRDYLSMLLQKMNNTIQTEEIHEAEFTTKKK